MTEQKSPDISRRTAIPLIAAGTAGTIDGMRNTAYASNDRPPVLAPKPVVSEHEYEQAKPQMRLGQLIEEGERYIRDQKYANVGEGVRMQDLKRIGNDFKHVIDIVLEKERIQLAPEVKKALLGIILIESKGNETQPGGGLCQISDVALEELVKSKPELAGKNMLNAYNNIWAAAAYLEGETKPNTDPLEAVWKFHIGPIRFANGKAKYMKEGLSETNQNIPISTLIDAPRMKTHLQEYYGQGNELDGALQYVSRSLAGADMIEQAMRTS